MGINVPGNFLQKCQSKAFLFFPLRTRCLKWLKKKIPLPFTKSHLQINFVHTNNAQKSWNGSTCKRRESTGGSRCLFLACQIHRCELWWLANGFKTLMCRWSWVTRPDGTVCQLTRFCYEEIQRCDLSSWEPRLTVGGSQRSDVLLSGWREALKTHVLCFKLTSSFKLLPLVRTSHSGSQQDAFEGTGPQIR